MVVVYGYTLYKNNSGRLVFAGSEQLGTTGDSPPPVLPLYQQVGSRLQEGAAPKPYQQLSVLFFLQNTVGGKELRRGSVRYFFAALLPTSVGQELVSFFKTQISWTGEQYEIYRFCPLIAASLRLFQLQCTTVQELHFTFYV